MGYSASLILKLKNKIDNSDVIKPYQMQIGRGHIAAFIYPNVERFERMLYDDLGFSLEEIYQNLVPSDKGGLPTFQFGEFHVFEDDEDDEDKIFDHSALSSVVPNEMLKAINKMFFTTKRRLIDDIKIGVEKSYSSVWKRINALQEITEFYTSLRIILEIAKDNNWLVEISFEGSS